VIGSTFFPLLLQRSVWGCRSVSNRISDLGEHLLNINTHTHTHTNQEPGHLNTKSRAHPLQPFGDPSWVPKNYNLVYIYIFCLLHSSFHIYIYIYVPNVRLEMGKRGFKFAAPAAWNLLQTDLGLREPVSFGVFKNRLKELEGNSSSCKCFLWRRYMLLYKLVCVDLSLSFGFYFMLWFCFLYCLSLFYVILSETLCDVLLLRSWPGHSCKGDL